MTTKAQTSTNTVTEYVVDPGGDGIVVANATTQNQRFMHSSACYCSDDKLRRRLNMLLYRTQISRTDNGILVFFRKILWHLNGNLDFAYPTP